VINHPPFGKAGARAESGKVDLASLITILQIEKAPAIAARSADDASPNRAVAAYQYILG